MAIQPTDFPRNPEEILAKVASVKMRRHQNIRHSAFMERLTTALPIEHAGPILKVAVTDASEKEWAKTHIKDVPRLRLAAKRFLEGVENEGGKILIYGAWPRANEAKHPFEAQRNCGHIAAFSWLLGSHYDDFVDELLGENQLECMGKHHLVRFCEIPEINVGWQGLDNDEWKIVIGDDECVSWVPAGYAMKELEDRKTS